jgi:hypothetical protein
MTCLPIPNLLQTPLLIISPISASSGTEFSVTEFTLFWINQLYLNFQPVVLLTANFFLLLIRCSLFPQYMKKVSIHNKMLFFLGMNKQYQTRPVVMYILIIIKQLCYLCDGRTKQDLYSITKSPISVGCLNHIQIWEEPVTVVTYTVLVQFSSKNLWKIEASISHIALCLVKWYLTFHTMISNCEKLNIKFGFLSFRAYQTSTEYLKILPCKRHPKLVALPI